MREFLYSLCLGLILVGACAAIGTFALQATDRSNRAECLTWRKEATTMPDYYITEWQAEQCTFLGVSIMAPVRKTGTEG